MTKLKPPLPPMEALSVDQAPVGKEWQYEPKWDGFRCLVFRDGDKITLQSKSGKPLTRYFPDLVEVVRSLTGGGPSCSTARSSCRRVGKRVFVRCFASAYSPAESRVEKLAKETPALLIVFDLLADDRCLLTDQPLPVRRKRLEAFAKNNFTKAGRLRLSPSTTKLSEAKKWLAHVGATLDGIVAKRRDMPYSSGNRHGMQKIKNYRSADCVVGGFRYNEGKRVVGSLLLRTLRQGWQAQSRWLHFEHPKRGQAGLDAEVGKTDRITGLHG